MVMGGAKAQAQLIDQEAAVVYYSPKNYVTLDFTYTVEKQESGQYAAYAEELLGITDVIKETKTTYTIKNVAIGTATVTDYERPHVVSAEKGIPTQLLRINGKNLLVGYNMAEAAEHKCSRTNAEDNAKQGIRPKRAVPFTEEIAKAKGARAKAQAIAKQIFTIRETRSYLLNGEVEHAPADGESMRLVLDELNEQEKQLLDLFVGTKHKRTEHKIMRVMPILEGKTLERVQTEEYFFSTENGFTTAENIDAQPIQVAMHLHRPAVKHLSEKEQKSRKAAEVSQIVYNQPGYAEVEVKYQDRTLSSRSLPIAQLGVDVPLAKDLFLITPLPVIEFSEKTGNIVSITK